MRDPTADPRPRVAHVLLLATALLVTGAVYHPITRNYFHGDDFLNLQWIANDPFLRYVLQPFGGHLLIVRSTLFWLFYRAFGMEPAYYFWVVLLTHLVNVGLLFDVIQVLTGSLRLACFGAALWGIAPVNEGSLGWYSVYGHVVVASLVLVTIDRMVRCLPRPEPLALREALLWYVLLLLASMAFGVGLGIALTFPAVVLLLFGPARVPWRVRVLLASLPPVALACYAAAQVLYAYTLGGPSDENVRKMLQLLVYSQAIPMVLHLVAVGVTALVGNFVVSLDAYPSWLAYGITGAYVMLLFGVTVWFPPATRRLLCALLVVTLSGYAIIAAGRAGLYDAFHIRVYGAYAPRYHYFAPIPLAIALCIALARVGDALGVRGRAASSLLLAWLTCTGFLYWWSGWKVDHHDSERLVTGNVVQSIRASIAAAPLGQTVYITNQPFPPAILQAPFFAGWASVFTFAFPQGAGRPVYFVEKDANVRAVGRPGTRLAAVLIPPESVNAPPAGSTQAPR